MFEIWVIDGGTSTKISHRPGDNLLSTLRAAGFNIRTGCQHSGACALCQITIRAGNAGPVTVTEKLQLGRRLKQGIRLACQVVPAGDLVVGLVAQPDSAAPAAGHPELKSAYRTDGFPGNQPSGCAVSVDIGTTNVGLAMFRRENCELLTARTFTNPQRDYGTDVIARMLRAAEDPAVSEEIQNKLFDKLRESLQEMALAVGVATEDITALGVVGNTAMLALFSRRFYRQLLNPRYWETAFSFRDADKSELRDFFRLDPRADVAIIDPLAGFVGSDLLAGLTAIRILDKEPGTLFVDFGTNTEIALWDGAKVWATAAAGGPAFEGCGMSCGCPAVPGAIYKVRPSAGSETPFTVLTIDDREAVGICGSGYVDIIAALLADNVIDPVGRLPARAPEDQEIALTASPPITVTKQDIDTFQRAKAAVAAGIRVLSRQAAMSPETINRVFVAGNFGRFLDLRSAEQVGLLPGIDRSRIHVCPSAALRGCADILLYREASAMLDQIRNRSTHINLAFDAEFESVYMECLYLKPF